MSTGLKTQAFVLTMLAVTFLGWIVFELFYHDDRN